jgi:hypothetical protein
MNIELIHPRFPDKEGKMKLNGIIRLDGWLSFSFKLYESEKGFWTKLGDSYKDRDDNWKDVVYYKKNTEYYKMVHNEIMDAYKRECDTMSHKAPMSMQETADAEYKSVESNITADDIPF